MSRSRLVPSLVCALALLPVFRGAAADVVSRFVFVNGVSVHVLDTAPGRSDLATAILVHGWAGSASDFQPLLDRLDDGRRWVAFDFPGCGASDRPDMHYSITGMADFVEQFREALGVDTVDLVGHSFGGQIAVHCTVRNPSRVRRLVLIDPDGLAGEEGRRIGLTRLGPLVDIVFGLNSRCTIRCALRRNVFHGATGLEGVVEGSAYLLTRGGRRAIARITREALGTEPVDALLPLVGQDTLLIWGVEDRLLPIGWADGWMRGLARAEWCPIPECGHMPIAEKPAETAAALEEFLQRL